MVECRFFQRGYCQFGDKCKNEHTAAGVGFAAGLAGGSKLQTNPFGSSLVTSSVANASATNGSQWSGIQFQASAPVFGGQSASPTPSFGSSTAGFGFGQSAAGSRNGTNLWGGTFESGSVLNGNSQSVSPFGTSVFTTKPFGKGGPGNAQASEGNNNVPATKTLSPSPFPTMQPLQSFRAQLNTSAAQTQSAFAPNVSAKSALTGPFAVSAGAPHFSSPMAGDSVVSKSLSPDKWPAPSKQFSIVEETRGNNSPLREKHSQAPGFGSVESGKELLPKTSTNNQQGLPTILSETPKLSRGSLVKISQGPTRRAIPELTLGELMHWLCIGESTLGDTPTCMQLHINAHFSVRSLRFVE